MKSEKHILTQVCRIEKNGTDEPICRVGIETDVKNKRVDTVGEKGGWDKLGD